MKSPYMTSRFERFSYGLYFLGQNIFYMFVLMFLIVYFTDIGIPAATVAIVSLAVKVWDAVNDPIFGGVVDGVKLKKGKFLPWLRISLIMIPLATIALFAIPSGLPVVAKVTWAVFAYMLWDTAYTICDVPIFGLVTTMTNNQAERTSVMAIGRVFGLAAAIIISVLVPIVRQAIGGWLPTAIVLSIIALVTMAPVCFSAKERIAPSAAEKGISIKEMSRFVLGNKYMLIFYCAILVYSSLNISMALGMYFARYCLGDESMFSILSIAGILPGIVLGAFIPAMSRKLDKFHIFFWSLVASAAVGIVLFFVGYSNLTMFLIVTFIRSVPIGAIGVLTLMFTPDFVEYGTYKTGINASGTAFAVQTFTVKLMAAIATALGAATLAAIGFVESEGAVQAASFADKLWNAYILIPILGSVIAIPILLKYKLRDKDVQIMARANQNEISREEADALLAAWID